MDSIFRNVRKYLCIVSNFELEIVLYMIEIAQHIINYPKLEIYSLTLSTLEDSIIYTEL